MTQFRKLPTIGGDPRSVAEIVNNIINGKTNNTGLVTLDAGGSRTTVIKDERISIDTKIVLVPFSAAAFSDTVPYAQFLCTAGQTAASPDTAYDIGYNTVIYESGIELVDNTKITVKNAGVYNIQFSIQFENQDNVQHDVSVWFRKNGVNIDDSNSIFTVPQEKSANIYGKLIGTVNIFVDLDADDYASLAWSTESTNVILKTDPVQTSPDRPATPCVILTVNYVSPSSGSNVYVSSQQRGEATISHFANEVADKTYGYILIG
jgi:hypothetical protein